MADKSTQPNWDPLALAGQLQTIAGQSQRLMQRVSSPADATKIGMGDASTLGGAFLDLMTKMMSDPTAVANAQIDLFNDSMTVWRQAAERMCPDAVEPEPARTRGSSIRTGPRTRCSASSAKATSSPRSRFCRRSATSRGSMRPARKVDFYTRQFVDAISPSNFIATNPEVLTTTLQTGGQNLLRGLENLLADLDGARAACPSP